MGIELGNRERIEEAIGPGIRFVGKTKTGRVDSSTSRQVESSKGYMAAKELVYDAILRRAPTSTSNRPKTNCAYG